MLDIWKVPDDRVDLVIDVGNVTASHEISSSVDMEIMKITKFSINNELNDSNL